MADPLQKAEKALDEASRVYSATMNGDGLVNVATTWLALWEHMRNSGQKQFGFSFTSGNEEQTETDAVGDYTE